jgi:putative tryptophan/tyrosine transport system substrate-binding protein
MTRRELIAFLGSTAAVSWPGAVSAQQTKRKRRVGVLMNLAADDKEGQARLIAIVQTLSDLGWKNGSNVQIEACWGAGDTSRFHQCAAELVAQAPDIILAASASTIARLLPQFPMCSTFRVALDRAK